MIISAAFTIWGGRIAPVFDVAHQAELVVWDSLDAKILSRSSLELLGKSAAPKIMLFKEQKVDVVICGAISSQALEEAVKAGFKVIPFVAGEMEEIIAAWTEGILEEQELYRMPGCCTQNRRRTRRRQHCGNLNG